MFSCNEMLEKHFLSRDERHIWVTKPVSSECVCVEKRGY